MRLRDEQIDRLAERVLSELSSADQIRLRKERGGVLAGIKEAVKADLLAEEALERDAAALLDQTLRSMRGGPEIDRHKMLRMIKEKLAKERKIVL